MRAWCVGCAALARGLDCSPTISGVRAKPSRAPSDASHCIPSPHESGQNTRGSLTAISDFALSMRSSLRASSRQLVSSPKESGEIGETIGDMIARHPHSAERVKSLVSRIEEHAELMTPGIATASERGICAARWVETRGGRFSVTHDSVARG